MFSVALRVPVGIEMRTPMRILAPVTVTVFRRTESRISVGLILPTCPQLAMTAVC
jgi:hypothetical protein